MREHEDRPRDPHVQFPELVKPNCCARDGGADLVRSLCRDDPVAVVTVREYVTCPDCIAHLERDAARQRLQAHKSALAKN